MKEIKSENQIIVEKAIFINEYSGIIFTKLKDPHTRDETSNSLQTLLLSNYSLKELDYICNIMIKKNKGRRYLPNSYYCSIGIIFDLCYQLNYYNLNTKEKENLRNVLRQYTKYFKESNSTDYLENQRFVKFKKL